MQLESVNRRVLEQLQPEQAVVEILPVQELEDGSVEEAELDEIWSYVKSKDNPRWLWHAIDRSTGQVLAYVFGALVFRAPELMHDLVIGLFINCYEFGLPI